MLRNCEHLSRYIAFNSWYSSQTIGDEVIIKLFTGYYNEDVKPMMNRLPKPLDDFKPDLSKINSYNPYIKFLRFEICLEKGFKTYNFLFIGPTGSGKSLLINKLFNKTLCKSQSSIRSVTKDLKLIIGEMIVKNKMSKICCVDTIGMCDSTLKPIEVIELLKLHIKNNVFIVDHVFILLPQRLTLDEMDSIKLMLKWLNYPDTHDYFTFIFTKKRFS